MAERNPQAPQSIQSLLYVERNGNYCGYKPELITDKISMDLGEFLICSECKAISRMPIQEMNKTSCSSCVNMPADNIDTRVQNKVLFLNAKCPLWGRGCEWKGKLGRIEKHMQVCQKMLVECQLKCGIIFERETTEQHSNEICQFRTIECEFCREKVRINKENQHIGECMGNQDTEIPCPYKELGCDAIILRKNKGIHLTESMMGHQRLMLDQLSQLRERNQEQNKRMEEIDAKSRRKSLALIAAGIIIVLCICWIMGANIQANSQKLNSSLEQIQANSQKLNSSLEQIQANSQKLNSSLEQIQANSQKLNSSLEQIQANSQNLNSSLEQIQANSQKLNSSLEQIQANSQKLNSSLEQIQANSQKLNSSLEQIQEIQLSNKGSLSDYIGRRSKIMPGIEWIHDLGESGYICGSTFYLEQCLLRLCAYIDSSVSDSTGKNVTYYMQRVSGMFDSSISSCRITYTYSSYGYLDDIKPQDIQTSELFQDLVDIHYYLLSTQNWIYSDRKIRIRAYFDT